MKKKFSAFLEKDIAFILLLALASAGVVGATNLFLVNGTGLMNEIYIGEMLRVGQKQVIMQLQQHLL